MIDVAPASWGDLAGHVFVAEWGDLVPPTNPIRGKKPAGSRVVHVDPDSGKITPFLSNAQPGPASMNNAQGRGLDRPFEVEFGPDGALYIVDYGVVKIDKSLTEQGEPPYREVPGTGVIWKVTRTDDARAAAGAISPANTQALYAEWAGDDGTLTLEEWDKGVDARFGEQAVNLAAAEWDDNGDGIISREEFQAAVGQLPQQ